MVGQALGNLMKKIWAALFGRKQLSLAQQRLKIPEGCGPVIDLDEIIESPTYFRLHKKYFQIKPIELQEFMGIAQSFAAITQIQNSKTLTGAELSMIYFDLFSKVIPDITHEDVQNMTQSQCGALFIAIMDKIEGKSASSIAEMLKNSEKKKLAEPLSPRA